MSLARPARLQGALSQLYLAERGAAFGFGLRARILSLFFKAYHATVDEAGGRPNERTPTEPDNGIF